eukprot:360049-Chlamydomonas_euryale.AAC.2
MPRILAHHPACQLQIGSGSNLTPPLLWSISLHRFCGQSHSTTFMANLTPPLLWPISLHHFCGQSHSTAFVANLTPPLLWPISLHRFVNMPERQHTESNAFDNRGTSYLQPGSCCATTAAIKNASPPLDIQWALHAITQFLQLHMDQLGNIKNIARLLDEILICFKQELTFFATEQILEELMKVMTHSLSARYVPKLLCPPGKPQAELQIMVG